VYVPHVSLVHLRSEFFLLPRSKVADDKLFGAIISARSLFCVERFVCAYMALAIRIMWRLILVSLIITVIVITALCLIMYAFVSLTIVTVHIFAPLRLIFNVRT